MYLTKFVVRSVYADSFPELPLEICVDENSTVQLVNITSDFAPLPDPEYTRIRDLAGVKEAGATVNLNAKFVNVGTESPKKGANGTYKIRTVVIDDGSPDKVNVFTSKISHGVNQIITSV